MNRRQKNYIICRLAELVGTALSEDGIRDGNDVRDAVSLIKEIDAKFACANNRPKLANVSRRVQMLAKFNQIRLP